MAGMSTKPCSLQERLAASSSVYLSYPTLPYLHIGLGSLPHGVHHLPGCLQWEGEREGRITSPYVSSACAEDVS
jgi:hypothetical protein